MALMLLLQLKFLIFGAKASHVFLNHLDALDDHVLEDALA